MTEFILAITEFYTPNTDGFAHLRASCWCSLLAYFLHTLILYHAHGCTVCAESDLWQKKSKAHFLAWLFRWKIELSTPGNCSSSHCTPDDHCFGLVSTLHVKNPLNRDPFFPPTYRFVKCGKASLGSYPCECDFSGLIFPLFLPVKGNFEHAAWLLS